MSLQSSVRLIRAMVPVSVIISNDPAAAQLVCYEGFGDYAAGVQVESGSNGSGGTSLDAGVGWGGAYNVSDAIKSLVKIENRSSSPVNYANGEITITGGSRALRFDSIANGTYAVRRPSVRFSMPPLAIPFGSASSSGPPPVGTARSSIAISSKSVLTTTPRHHPAIPASASVPIQSHPPPFPRITISSSAAPPRLKPAFFTAACRSQPSPPTCSSAASSLTRGATTPSASSSIPRLSTIPAHPPPPSLCHPA